MDTPQDDLISCLCVTRHRVDLLRRAVACFHAQTHQNRELVIVFDADDPETRAYVHSILAPSILAIEVGSIPRLTLGANRNLSVQIARGRYVAQWDDDDWHAPDRLRAQLAVMAQHQRPACVLVRQFLFDGLTGQASVSATRTWENSLLARRDAMPKYPELPKMEDTPVIQAMLAGNLLVGLDRPDLYVYVYHGKNTWERAHWEAAIAAFAQPLPVEETARIAQLLLLHGRSLSAAR